MMSAVKRYFKNPTLTVESMKSVSKAGTGLLTWVAAISKYYDIAKNVEPLRAKVRDMERAQQVCDAMYACLYVVYSLH
jgi:dynein heavy chain, axonemal